MQHPSGTATDYYGRTQGKGDQKSAYSPKKTKTKAKTTNKQTKNTNLNVSFINAILKNKTNEDSE